MSNETTIRQDLARVEARIEQLTNELRRAEGERDGLLSKLLDLEGAHDQRVVAVR